MVEPGIMWDSFTYMAEEDLEDVSKENIVSGNHQEVLERGILESDCSKCSNASHR